MIKIYPVIFHTETNGSYWGEFPDFAGGTQDDNLEEAKRNAKEFLSGVHVEFVESLTFQILTKNLVKMSFNVFQKLSFMVKLKVNLF